MRLWHTNEHMCNTAHEKFCIFKMAFIVFKKMLKNWIFFAGTDLNPTNHPVVPVGTPGAGQHTQDVQPVITHDGE